MMPLQTPISKVSFASLTHRGQYTDNYPLGIAMVAAYVKQRFGKSIEVEIYKHPDEFAFDLENFIPPIVCFSTYVWNLEISYEFARRIKRQSPKTVVIFGGPNFPLFSKEQERFLADLPVVDFFVFREGEYALSILLEFLFKFDLNVEKLKQANVDLKNTYYLRDNHLIQGSALPPITNLENLPSPYLTGISDKLLNDEKITPLIQIARGCPFKCSFCQEGEEYFNKVRRFSLNRLLEELRYIATRTRSPVLQLADSNFGMYKADLEICEHIAKIQKEFGWPKYVADFSGKNQKQRVLDALEIIQGSQFLSAAVQSTSPKVLKAVKRENVRWDEMIYVAQRGKKLDANSFAEVILALPADTKEDHFQSMKDLIDARMNVVRSHQFMMLLGSSGCSDTSRKNYKMQTRFRVMPNTAVPYKLFDEDFYAPEIDEICVANSTLSFDDYKECRLFDLTVELFYNNAIFDELYSFLSQSELSISELIENIHNSLRDVSGSLKKIQQDFLKETQELWSSKDDLKKILTSPNELKRYAKGEVGINEQIIFRTRAIFHHLDELHDLAFDEAKKLLTKNNAMTNQANQYLSELKEISLIRKLNALSFERPSYRTYSFDFVQLESENFKGEPSAFFKPNGVRIKVGHSQEQKELIDQYVEQYGLSETSLGYILSSASNFNNFYREISTI